MQVEDVFRQVAEGHKYAIKDLEAKLTSQLNNLVALVREPLSSHSRKKVNTLLIIDVHARDIVDGFVRESILNAKEFAWESQLRFYWDRDVDDCIIRQCTGEFNYGYEYMGMNGRLVITPLTDRCYMTLTQALTFKLGGAPAGPAGTGKTETTKDLAKSLALPCFVINCGEGLDYKVRTSTSSCSGIAPDVQAFHYTLYTHCLQLLNLPNTYPIRRWGLFSRVSFKWALGDASTSLIGSILKFYRWYLRN